MRKNSIYLNDPLRTYDAHMCTYPNCQRYGMGYDLDNFGKPISCPNRYGDAVVRCKFEESFREETSSTDTSSKTEIKI